MSKIRDELEKAARLNPDRVAIQFESTRLTFSQLREQVAATAYQLRASGLTADDTVALVLKNTPESVVMFLALAWLDASLIPLEAEHIKQLNSPRPFDGIPIKALLCEGSEFFGTTPISLPDGCSL